MALVKGTWEENDEVPVRVHSSSMLGDVFQITDFGKGPMLHAAMKKMDEIGCGVLVYLNKLRQGGGILDELNAYERIQHSGQHPRAHGHKRLRHWCPNRPATRRAQLPRMTNTERTLGPSVTAHDHQNIELGSTEIASASSLKQQKRDRMWSLFSYGERRCAYPSCLSAPFLSNLPYFWRNLSIRPAVSTNCALPV